jgi:RHS repeat-associated protein
MKIPGRPRSIANTYAGTYNNGNLLKQELTVPGISQPIPQHFLYDGLNRLQLAVEKPTSEAAPVCPDIGSTWCDRFGYDNWGNRSLQASTNVGVVAPQNFSTANNRITDSGWGYDAAGNLNVDNPGPMVYKYDAENRQVAACTASGETPATCTDSAAAGRTIYRYDGNGRRVAKQTAAGVTTTYIYDAFGQLAAEYGGPAATQTTSYLTVDHLGSTRVVTDNTQSVTSRHDLRPFGDEIGAGSRTGATGYTADDSITLKFTGKERDTETGLDYFGARYFSAAQGRWTSPDWSAIPQPVPYAELGDPQTLNLYAYVTNRPLNKADVDGHCPWCIGAGAGALIGGGIETYKQYKAGKGFDLWKIASKTLQGSINGAVAVATGGQNLLIQTTSLAAANMVGGIAGRAIDHDPKTKALDPKKMTVDTVAGGAGGFAGGIVGAALKSEVGAMQTTMQVERHRQNGKSCVASSPMTRSKFPPVRQQEHLSTCKKALSTSP